MKQLYFLSGYIVDARVPDADERKALDIDDARKGHVAIFHPTTGALLNTMTPDDFAQHYTALEDLRDEPAADALNSEAAAPAADTLAEPDASSAASKAAPGNSAAGTANGNAPASTDPNDKP